MLVVSAKFGILITEQSDSIWRKLSFISRCWMFVEFSVLSVCCEPLNEFTANRNWSAHWVSGGRVTHNARPETNLKLSQIDAHVFFFSFVFFFSHSISKRLLCAGAHRFVASVYSLQCDSCSNISCFQSCWAHCLADTRARARSLAQFFISFVVVVVVATGHTTPGIIIITITTTTVACIEWTLRRMRT